MESNGTKTAVETISAGAEGPSHQSSPVVNKRMDSENTDLDNVATEQNTYVVEEDIYLLSKVDSSHDTVDSGAVNDVAVHGGAVKGGAVKGGAGGKITEASGEDGPLLKALDGGYGWVVVVASFMHHMVLGGFARSEGLFFLQYQDRFQSGAQLTSWPSSLMSTLNLFMGPLCGAVVNRYSVRTALIIATLLTSLGFILNGLAPNVYFLFFSQTIVGGIGRGLMSTVLLLNLYFDKHRSSAQGFSSAGVGFGTFAIVPLVQLLFEEYGFTGAFLIIGSIQLNGLVAAMFFRPLSMHLRFLRADRLKKRRLANGEEGDAMTDMHDSTSDLSNPEDDTVTVHLSKEDDAEIKSMENGVEPFLASCETLNVATSLPKINKIPKKSNWLKSSLAICFPVEHKRKDVASKREAFHWHLLKNIPFLVFCVSNTFFLMAFKTAFTFMPAMALSKGLTRTEAALVLTISGALDTFGRMATGFLMDIPACRPFRPYVFNLLLFFIAGASFLVPSLDSFASFCVVSSAYGFMTGAFISQKIVVLVDILGREVMPSSLGINKVFQGVGTLVGPPFAGALRDALGTFDSSFYLGGACMFGAGLLMTLSNILLKVQKHKQKKNAGKEIIDED